MSPKSKIEILKVKLESNSAALIHASCAESKPFIDERKNLLSEMDGAIEEREEEIKRIEEWDKKISYLNQMSANKSLELVEDLYKWREERHRKKLEEWKKKTWLGKMLSEKP